MAKCGKALVFKHQVTAQAAARVSDGQGGGTVTWSDVAPLWANIEPVKGYERMQAQQLAAPVTHKITMRWNDWLTVKHRISYQTRIFEIKELINVDEANHLLKLICLEG